MRARDLALVEKFLASSSIVDVTSDFANNRLVLIVGGGDSAVEAAMGLAHQAGDEVMLCYRGERFSRIKERNVKRMEDCTRTGKVKVFFETNPLEFTADSVVLAVKGVRQEFPNDFVWIFAGGNPQ
jgi:thioredoxin reductase